jgi:type IV pilus secretin PilQ/predicted competence protein
MRRLWIGLAVLLLVAIAKLTAEESAPALDPLDNIVESVEFENAPIADILRLLARQNDLNLIIGPDTMGTVSLRFSDVTLRAALDAILRAKGFQYQVYDNIMLVMKPDSLEKLRGLGMETRLFKLKYTDARDMKTVIDTSRILSPWGYATVFSRMVSTEAVKAGVLVPRTDQTGGGATANLTEPVQRGVTPLQTRSDVLLVTDRKQNLESVEKLIRDLDKPVRQIAIDVKFIETILTEDQQVGIDWQQLLSIQGTYKGATDWQLGGRSPTGQGSGTLQFGALDQLRFNVILDLLLKNQRAKLLSQPRIATMDNQPATIGIGVSTWIESRTSDANTGTFSVSYQERRVPIEMVVVPHILEGDRVLLEIRPVVEEITGWQEGAQGEKLPLISSRTADSRIEVKDGETAVIGGLLKDKLIWNTKKVWLLGSIPLIGKLFQHQVQSVERTDLSIFITPRIMREGEAPHFASLPGLDIRNEDSLNTRSEDSLTALKASIKKELPESLPEVIDLRAYFPLPFGAKWVYNWTDINGEKWQSNMVIDGRNGDVSFATESIPAGKYASSSRLCYKWDAAGLVNLYKVTSGKDSIFYSPVRYILPMQMQIGKDYENSYVWTNFGVGGQKTGLGQVKQTQRLVRREGVTAPTGRYKDCILIETNWWDPKDPDGTRKRKLVWYARDVGPVRVEHDLPQEPDAVKGRMSALIGKG